MPYINVNDVYIMDNTGKQVDDAVDYALANSNENLIDNWYFVGGGSQLGEGVLPINQKELTSYPEAGYNIDRWISTTLTVATDGITATGALYQVQSAPFMARLLGETLTASVLLADGTMHTGSLTLPATLPASATMYTYSGGNSVSGVTAQLYLTTAGTAQFLRITTAKKIAAVKVEKGLYSTLINDIPHDFGGERRKCQEHFFRLKSINTYYPVAFGYATAATTAIIFIPTPVTMLANPSVSLTGSAALFGNGGSIQVASVSAGGTRYANGVAINVTTTASMVVGQLYVFGPSNGGYLDFNANI